MISPAIRIISCMLGALAFVGAASATGDWPAIPSRTELDTPFGMLNVAPSEYVYESRLRLGARVIDPEIKGILNITHAFQTPRSLIALVSVDNGNAICPLSYRWVVLRQDDYDVSDAFGSCTEKIRVSVKGTKFIVETPNKDSPDKIDSYVYDGKAIQLTTRR